MAESIAIATGLRVLEVGSGISGALAGMVLADNGAEVLKLEGPSGDPYRSLPAFRMWNRGKLRIAGDLALAVERERVRELALSADVVLASWRPGTAQRFGLDHASLETDNPRLVSCEITGFGDVGPYAHYPGYDGVVAAKAGRMVEFSSLDGGKRPTYAAVPVAAFGASQLALQGIFSALVARERDGRGQRVQTSLVQALTVYDMMGWLPGGPMPLRLADTPDLGYLPACTGDGRWVQFAQRSPAQFQSMMRNLGLAEEAATTDHSDPANTRALRALVLARMREKTFDEWMKIFDQDKNMAVAPFLEAGAAFDHPQMLHNGDVLERDVPGLGRVRELGPLARFSDTPSRPGTSARPDEPATPVAEAHWQSPPLTAKSQSSQASGDRVLDGIVVLELATWIATPTAATLLAELGARVIKIEPLGGDPLRAYPFVHWNTTQGKQSVTLDLKSAQGQQILQRLAARADILLHNYRPGVPERLGMDYETLRALNPRLIYLYGASYGSTGPYSSRPAYHPTFGALCGGVHKQLGAGVLPAPDAELTPDELARVSRALEHCNESNPDFNAGIASTTSALLALFHRERTGRGQAVETTMLCSNAYANASDFIAYEGRPPCEVPDAKRLGLGPLYRLYQADEGWVFLGCATQREFAKLCAGLGREQWLEQARFADASARAANADALATELERAFAEKGADAWESTLTALGVGCVRADRGPFGSFLHDEPYCAEAGFTVEVIDAEHGPYRRAGPPVRLSRDSGEVRSSNAAGQQNRAILAELGYDETQIADFEARSVVAPRSEAN